ncbi:hypothetical protein Esti_004954 [Eimeria stiedai]
MSASRCSEFHFVNLTSVTFYRHLHILHHGGWKRQPPEAIQPREEMVCLSEATRSLGTFSGKIQYAVVLAGVEYIICSEFEIPVLGESKHVSVMGCNVDARAQQLPEAKNLFDLSFTADSAVFSKFVVTLREKPEGAAYVANCRRELHLALEQQVEGCSFDPTNLPSEIPLHFLWNVRNVDWRRRLRRAHRSLLIRIVNLTGFLFVLDKRGADRLPLEEGVWVEFPSEQIPPLCCTEFGCQSDGFLLGTGGSCTYLIANQPGHLLFVWDQPGMGGCRSLGVHSTRVLRVFRHSENLNEGTIVFHVIDPANPPLIQIKDARALSPQAWGASSSSRPEASSSCLSVGEATKTARFGADVLPVLLTFLEQQEEKKLSQQQSLRGTAGGGGPAAAAAAQRRKNSGGRRGPPQQRQQLFAFKRKQIIITSPRAFFCVLQGFKSYRSLCAPNSLLLLSWRLGCERFFRVWGPDEKIALTSWHVAGLQEPESGEAVMRAQVLNLRRVPPEILKMQLTVSPLHTDASNPSSFLPASDDSLLEVLLEGLRIFTAGLQPEVDKCMQRVLGLDWLEKYNLPKQHLWPGGPLNGEGELIDLEGLLHLVTAFWNEVFEQKVKDPQILQNLQTVAIWWATQELSRFDAARVFSFLRVSAIFLRRFDAEAPAKRLEALAQSVATSELLDSNVSPEVLLKCLGSRGTTPPTRQASTASPPST